ncbi:MAG: 2,3-diaminopropionate biosynthesis protein SbnA [Pyrinomonadaceae bacterium]
MRSLETEPGGEGVLSAIGRTPLVSIKKAFRDAPFQLYAKLESLNPGGSMKDRPALSIIRDALERGVITRNTVVVESSSGNMGIGLAQVCAYYGLQFICVVDSKTTPANVRLLKAYGAEVDIVTEPDPTTHEYLQARLNRVQTLLHEMDDSFWPDQYSNAYNYIGHYQTMDEISHALGRLPDYLFCATSTCGSLRGCAEYVLAHKAQTKIIAVDAIGSVIFGGPKLPRLIPGHGAAVRPPLFQEGLATRYVHVSDLDCVVGCWQLLRHEALLAGGSSGAVFSAVARLQEEIEPGAICVMLLADRGERYLDTIFSDEWVREHFGELSHLWQETVEGTTCVTGT